MASAPEPPREQALDAVRAVALFGVLAMNLLTGFRMSLFEHYFGGYRAQGLDGAVDAVAHAALDGKAFVVFSLLFGVGLGIQAERGASLGFGVRRMAALLAFGLAHLLLVWNGDVLAEYALAGLLALPLLRAPTETVATVAALSLAAHATDLGGLAAGALGGWLQGDALARHVAEAHAAYGGGGFADALAFRVREARYVSSLLVAVFPRTYGLLLLGVLAARRGLALRPGEHRRALGRLAVGGLVLGGAGTLALSAGARSALLERLSPSALGVGYAAALLLAAARPGAWLRGLAPLGRASLSAYLSQSLVFTAVFHGWGLGLFDRVGSARALALGVSVYAAQALAARAWLARRRLGPAEALWRALAYRRP